MIHVECKPDVRLVKKLTGLGNRFINHAGSKSEVVKRVEREDGGLGLVDEDPSKSSPKAMKNYQPYRSLSKRGLKVLKRRNRFLIVLCPKLEDWIIKAAEEGGVDAREYNLPRSGEKLHEVINTRLDKFEKLLDGIEESPRIKMLKKILNEFIS